MLLAPGGALASSLQTITFASGSLTNLRVDDLFSQGSFEDLSYRYEDCGSEPAELTCTWRLHARLFSDLARRCTPSTPESQLLWDSGEQSGNGTADSGSRSFALEGCRGQVVGVSYEAQKTYDPSQEEGPWKTLSSGSSGSLLQFTIGDETVTEIEANIRAASPPARPAPPPIPPRLAVSSSCHQLKIGMSVYAFAFRRMSCRKATDLAARAQLGSSAPSGYVCKAQRGGRRCWRQGHPRKYLEWHRAGSS